MKKYVNIIFKHRKPLIALFVILNIVAIFGVAKMKLNTDFALFTTNDSKYEERLDDLEVTFGSSNQITVMVEASEFNQEELNQLITIQTKFNTIDNLSSIQGVAPETIMLNMTAVYIENVTPEMLTQYYSSFGDFSPIKEKDDTFYFIYTLIATDDFNKDDVLEIESILDSVTLESYIAGDTYNQYKLVTYITGILILLPPLAILIILIVFRLQLGAFKPTILSVLPAAIGSLWTFGIIGYIGNEVSIMTAIVPIFIIVIGSADGLHFITHYQEAIEKKMDNKTAMERTLKVVGIPMIITTLTSMAGFIALLTMNTDSIVDLAVFSALGILLAGVATWYVLPVILSGGMNIQSKSVGKHDNNTNNLLKKVWGVPAFIVAIVIIALGLLFTPAIRNEFDMLSVYKNYTDTAKSAEKLQEVNGGSIPLFIEYKVDDIITVEVLNDLKELTTSLSELEEVEKVINPYSMIEHVYFQQSNSTFSSDMELKQFYAVLSMNESMPIHTMISEESNTLRLFLYSSDLENDTLGVIETFIEENNEHAQITGVQYLLRDLNVQLNSMQVTSIALALALVLIMLSISLRDIKTAVISILPILITISSVYAMLGITGISLNITTVLIFSISIGVGIDYAVHYSSVFKLYKKETGNHHESIKKAFNDVSKPVIANALGVSLGLSALMLSPFTIHMNISILMWVSMIVSVFVTLTLIPSILNKLKQ